MLECYVLAAGLVAVGLGSFLLWWAWGVWERIDDDREWLSRLRHRVETDLELTRRTQTGLAKLHKDMLALDAHLGQQQAQFYAEVREMADPYSPPAAPAIIVLGAPADPSQN